MSDKKPKKMAAPDSNEFKIALSQQMRKRRKKAQ